MENNAVLGMSDSDSRRQRGLEQGFNLECAVYDSSIMGSYESLSNGLKPPEL